MVGGTVHTSLVQSALLMALAIPLAFANDNPDPTAVERGRFFALDRKTGEHLLTTPFVETNWAKGINTAGQPVRDTAKDPQPDGSLVSPGSNGATKWLSPSFDPQTGMAYVRARRQWSVFYKTAEGTAEGWGGRDRNLYSEAVLEGIDYKPARSNGSMRSAPVKDRPVS